MRGLATMKEDRFSRIIARMKQEDAVLHFGVGALLLVGVLYASVNL